ESYSLIEDSGGPGRFRGGMGLRRGVRPLGHTCTFHGAVERSTHRPWGVFGGGSRGPGRFFHAATHAKRTPPAKRTGLAGREDETIVIESPGAGGYGPPSERPSEAIMADEASGKFSRQYIDQWYGLSRAAE